MPDQKTLITAVLTAFAVETLCTTWLLKIPGCAPFLAIFYFLAGICIACLLPYFLPLTLQSPEKRIVNRHYDQYRLVIIGLLGLAMYSWCRYWFEEIPIDIYNADMLPVIKVMDQRFLAGQHKQVYDLIPDIWGGIYPIYLPAMWLPYVPAVALHHDMRWVTMAGLLFSFGVFIFIYRPNTHRYLSFFTGVLAFLLFWWLLADNTPGIVSVSEEGVVIAYFVVLVLSIVSGKPWLIGIAASFCMLSRYSLVGWIPAYLVYLILQKKWRHATIFACMGIVCFVLLFLVPVGWQTFMRLLRLPGNYIEFAGRVWNDSPAVFSTSLGFAGYFGPHRVALLHGLLIMLSFVVPVVFVVRNFRKGLVSNLPLATLKLTLVVFYSFIDVPYLYLFYTSSFVSLITVALLIRQRRV